MAGPFVVYVAATIISRPPKDIQESSVRLRPHSGMPVKRY